MSKYVGVLVQDIKYLQVVLAHESHQRTMICEVHIEYSFDWVCNFVCGIPTRTVHICF